jgi:5-hydroxyisourate hydrolase-like protein (transthyretin family)
MILIFQTISLVDYNILNGSFFVKMIDYDGNEIMLFEKKLENHETIVKKMTLNLTGLNKGVYSLQIKVWATLQSGKSLAIATPFYPIIIDSIDAQHKRLFAGHIIEII